MRLFALMHLRFSRSDYVHCCRSFPVVFRTGAQGLISPSNPRQSQSTSITLASIKVNNHHLQVHTRVQKAVHLP